MQLNNIPILVKVAFGPVLTIALLILTAWIGLSGVDTQRDRLQHVVEVEYARAITLSDIVSEFENLNGRVFRTLAFVASEDEETDLASDFADITTQLSEMQARLESFAQLYSGAERQSLEESAAKLAEYAETLEVVLEMVELDFASGVSLLKPFEQNSAKLISSLNALAAKQVKAAEAEYDIANQESQDVGFTLTVTTVIALIVSVVVVGFIAFQVTKSINKIAQSTLKLADGDMEIDLADRKDELGRIVSALAIFKDNLVENARMREEQERARAERKEQEEARRLEAEENQRREAEAERDRQMKLEVERRELMERLASEFDQQINSILQELRVEVQSVSDEASLVSSQAGTNVEVCSQLRGSSQRISGDIQTVAAATEEMSGTVQEIARQVAEASSVSQRAVSEADDSTTNVKKLADDAAKIGQIIGLIEDIAEQTNLLALNATIEAARAGDAGKGFAVVASEVKSLASQTTKATEEIATQVSGIQTATDSTVVSIENIGKTIRQIDEVSAAVAAAIEEQGAATQEINRTVNQANTEVQSLSEDSAHVADIAEKNGKAADTMTAATGQLAQKFENLEQAATAFLAAVRQ